MSGRAPPTRPAIPASIALRVRVAAGSNRAASAPLSCAGVCPNDDDYGSAAAGLTVTVTLTGVT